MRVARRTRRMGKRSLPCHHQPSGGVSILPLADVTSTGEKRRMRRVDSVAATALVLTAPASAGVAPPRLTNPGAWLQKREAPEGTLRKGERALTALDLTIAPDGSILTCDIALSSKSSALDQYACASFKQNARYEALKTAGENNMPRRRRDFWVWDAAKDADDSASEAVAAMPGSGAATWVTTDDLAKGVLARDQVVVSNVALTISPDGRVTACDVTLPSERPELDQRACDLMSTRAHYRPARGPDGRPTQGVDWKTIRRQVPND